MRISEIAHYEAEDAQMAAIKRQQRDLKVKKARIRASKAQAALRKAQQG